LARIGAAAFCWEENEEVEDVVFKRSNSPALAVADGLAATVEAIGWEEVAGADWKSSKSSKTQVIIS
jgi:hypothetical protein